MKIGIPKEIKTNENRVSLVPAGAEALVAAGHSCMSSRAPARDPLLGRAVHVGRRQDPATADAVWKEAEMISR